MQIDKSKFLIARANNCMTVPEIAASSGLNKGTIYKACNESVKPETVGKIAKALNVNVEDIIQED